MQNEYRCYLSVLAGFSGCISGGSDGIGIVPELSAGVKNGEKLCALSHEIAKRK